jgi:hypothetical protein
MKKIYSVEAIDSHDKVSPEAFLVQEGLMSPNGLRKSIVISDEYNEDSDTFLFGDSVCYRISRYSRDSDVYELSRLEAYGLINALVANQFGDLRALV